jgi:hypothetical protein
MDISEISLFDIIGDQTQERHKSTESNLTVNSDDFAAPEPEIEEEFEEQEHYDAAVEAEKLVNLINAGNIIALTPVAHFRLKKVRGGNKALEKMKIAYEKEVAGKALTEEDQKWVEKFRLYKSDMAMLNNEIQFTPKQKEVLMAAAVPFCESNKLKVNDSFAFYGILGGFEITKIMKILSV